MTGTSQRYLVIAIDWREPNVIASFADRAAAERYAEGMDRLALRTIVRLAPEPEATA